MLKKIAFVGAGSMAEAIISGMLHQQFVPNNKIFVTNKSDDNRLKHLEETYQVITDRDKEKVIAQADVVMLSMKPQDVKTALPSIRPLLTENQLIISVVAGVMMSTIQQLLQKEYPIIRAMPNTSASIGQSATALSKGPLATDYHLEIAQKLFETIGLTTVVDEEDMHVVTAISGSGPAYIYYLVEAMEQAAIEAGCNQQVAHELITQTIKGASEMLKRSNKTAKDLRKEITSPQGTTEAGLKTLASYNFKEAVQDCVHSARKRSIELGKNL